MNKLLILGMLLFASLSSVAQKRYTISGTVTDKATGESLIGATVSVEGTHEGTVTNEYGFFSISLPAASYTIYASYIGYTRYAEKLVLNQDYKLKVTLAAEGSTLQEVVVSDKAQNEAVTSAQMGRENLNVKQLASLPVLFGEKDVMKIVQLLPGVKAAGEGSTGFYVRGGAADQNLVLLDEAIVYNPSHLLSFFSVFNSDAIKNLTLYKGNQPAQYGGRLSSVMDVKTNDGNDQSYHASGGIGLIAARLNAEGPIVKGKGSFLVSARRTYADAFLGLSGDSTVRNNRLYFYDLNAKFNYKITDKDRIYLSGYYGKDVLAFGDVLGIDWGNATATLRWNHIFSSKLFSNTTLIYSDYRYKVHVNTAGVNGNMLSSIKDWNFKEGLDYYPYSNHSLHFGFNSIHHTITPGIITASPAVPDTANSRTWENAVYVSDSWKVTRGLNIDVGLRLSAFVVLGGDSRFYTLDDNRQIVDTLQFPPNHVFKTYVNFEPRISASYQLGNSSFIKAAYARNAQYLHLYSNFITSNPIDKWVATNNIIKPTVADQVSLGFFRNLKENTYESSVEAYYKAMHNVADYKDNARILNSNEPIEPQLLFGRGRAYGIEFSVKKNEGRLTGWLSYTLSRTELRIDSVNDNKWYPATQDRTHDLSVVGMYKLSKKWTLSADFVYYTGNAATFPSGKYEVDDQAIPYYTGRNEYRRPAYHRLDVGAVLKLKERKRFSSELAFSIYNAYGRQNPYVITFQTDPDDPTKTQALQTSLFRWVPSISYNFKF
ncbi:TonB-dependent receptor [Dyadobacter fermentans]|uniref:TonB-dependent receptor n=1 Tax=Dyadobacter fermentans TaxID=94254 RepID=UPI001CBF2111|nr:TonB-dependent receptor [Dyadobacter fermentans]MBZ1357804.1 TonB-dependent receptor [Dyadobacter fermentans]